MPCTGIEELVGVAQKAVDSRREKRVGKAKAAAEVGGAMLEAGGAILKGLLGG